MDRIGPDCSRAMIKIRRITFVYTMGDCVFTTPANISFFVVMYQAHTLSFLFCIVGVFWGFGKSCKTLDSIYKPFCDSIFFPLSCPTSCSQRYSASLSPRNAPFRHQPQAPSLSPFFFPNTRHSIPQCHIHRQAFLSAKFPPSSARKVPSWRMLFPLLEC